jgi:hypothetical protein
MENIDSIILPDLTKKPKTEKPPKKVLVEKSVVSRVNRNVVCGYCEIEKILNPDQYQLLLDTHGEDKIAEEYICKPCEMNMKRNPLEFWAIHGPQFKIMIKHLKNSFDSYKHSTRQGPDAVKLQTDVASIMFANKIVDPNYEFITENWIPVAMKIKNFPCVGSIILRVYEQGKNKIVIE